MKYDYIINCFTGLDQSMDESMISPGATADELNFETEGGRLKVAAGFSPLLSYPVPGEAAVDRVYVFRSAAKAVLLAFSGGVIYACPIGGSAWQSIHTYAVQGLSPHYCCTHAQIGTQDVVVISDGAHRMLKYDGTSVTEFGSSEGCSDIACAYTVMYRSRLFAAGDPEHPNRLYYSMLPGGDRSIENWGYYPASPSVEGGHIEIGNTGGDPITGLFAMSNQLLIFKKYSLYRLIGDRPGNFTVERMGGEGERTRNLAIASHNDVVYYLTAEGLHYFNGVDALPMPDMRRVKTLMDGASIASSRLVSAGGKLYFTVTGAGETLLAEYDIANRNYLLFGGFRIHDLCAYENGLALVSNSRRICLWGRGGSFDGLPILAHWRTPLTDLGDRSSIKTLRMLYLSGVGPGDVLITARTDSHEDCCTMRLTDGVAELPLKNEGRAFCLTIANDGAGFRLSGGLQLEMSVRRRTE